MSVQTPISEWFRLHALPGLFQKESPRLFFSQYANRGGLDTIIDVFTDMICRYEALRRWTEHPETRIKSFAFAQNIGHLANWQAMFPWPTLASCDFPTNLRRSFCTGFEPSKGPPDLSTLCVPNNTPADTCTITQNNRGFWHDSGYSCHLS